MSLQCCVPGCDNALGSSEAEKGSITFHSFPKNELPRLAWIKATCRLKITRVPHSSVVCSDHFKEDDFVVDTHKLMLKRGAIPSIFTPAQIQLMEERKEFLVPNITQQEKKKYSLPNSTQQKEKECSVPIITQQQVKDTGEGLDTSQCHQAQTDPMCKNTNRKVTDISLLCRICAKRSDRLIPIFEGEGLIVDLAVKMQQYLAMKIKCMWKLATFRGGPIAHIGLFDAI
ncbi:hypothetical protein LSTR_LSTR016599 [Laodelphax striatellus]|uniref:THAP-type domain-containing protein n=1 Tax=Laodelphax striatellus TaxID=195883 RepID=A0A482X2E5_LAOST|nr:hypothetical protein LSTR_LSTR016599 [Laodelphax striatellus]